MLLHNAMHADARDLSRDEIWSAIRAIGVAKLAIRIRGNAERLIRWMRVTPSRGEPLLAELRPYNARLDELAREDEQRRFAPRQT